MVNGKYSGLLLFNYIRIEYWLKLYFVSNLKSSARGTSISELQNIKTKRENYNVYTHSKKTSINIFCSLAPNQNCGNFKL